MAMRPLALLGILASCDPKPDVPATQPSGSGSVAAPKFECTDLAFASTAPVPEASGAAWIDIAGKPALFVIGDSGNNGAYVIVDAGDGSVIEQGVLPLGEGGGDDLEGIAARNGMFYAISSPGWIRTYKRGEKAFELVDQPYPLGPIDIDDKGGGLGDKPPKGSGMVCAAKNVNCGRNYEGICLQPTASEGKCVGYAAAKADGHLYCLIEERGKLVVRYADGIRVARPGVIADCAFSADGSALYAGSNLFDAGTIYRIDNWKDPANAKVVPLAPLGIGFPETLAVRGDIFYRMSDTGAAPSMMRKATCR